MQDKTVNLNLDQAAPPAIIHVTQGDTAWRWHFPVWLDGLRWSIPSGATAILKGTKPDGHVFAYTGSISSNEVVVDCQLQMTICAGPVGCTLIILDSAGKRLHVARIALLVAADPEAVFDVASDSALPAYAEVLGDISELLELASTIPDDLPGYITNWLDTNIDPATGYVLDNSLTLSNAAAPADKVGDLKNAFNADLVPLTWTPIITKGSYFKVADGATTSSNKYARTSALWHGYGTRKAIVVDDQTYEFCLALYDETGDATGSGYLGYVGYTKGIAYIPQNAKLFGISFRRSDNATLANSDITAISAALYAFAATDSTLSVAGAPADAKATGDMFSTAIVEKDSLPANTDLNSLTDIGLYKIPSGDSVIPTLVNYPSSNPGRLLVLSDENGDYCTQVVITSGNVIFTRVQTSASNHTWTNWASYDGSVVRTRSAIKNENDRYDADLTLTNGVYSFSATSVGNSDNLPSSSAGILLVFGGSAVIFQTYINRYGTVFYRIKYGENAFSEWYRPLKPDTTLSLAGAAADAKAVGDAVRSGYVHDGDILRMSTTPEAIPVNENHMGYNEFISTTWNTLLPTGYQDGDAYNASTTKIHGVKVERASSWTSTPYGANIDTYPIYRYIFTPQNGYDKTLFLTSGCHGNEAEAYWSLYRLVRMIYFEGHKYPTLRNLRDCRLIIIPSWNPWGFQHYRRYNAFSALNTGSTDVAKNYQAWAWLMAANHQVTVNGTVYDISQVGEANVIWQTLQDYGDSINLWLDLHTDPYAGRDTSNVDIDDPRGVTPPYGCYGFSAKDSRGYRQLFSVMYDFYNILEDEYQFTETWHPQATTPGGSSFTGWMAQFGFPSGVVEVSTFMNNFPYLSGSAGMMKLAQEYYGNCITEMLR